MPLLRFAQRQVRKVNNAIGDMSSSVAQGANSFGNDAKSGVADVWNVASGGAAQRDATKQLMQGADQSQQAISQGTQQAQGLMADYQDPNGYKNFQNSVQGGQFNPQFNGYQGLMSSGNVQPEYQNYDGPMQSNLESGSTANLAKYGMNGFQANMPNAPQRQEATAENIQQYMNPFLDQIIAKGNRAIENSAAARGGLDSSRTYGEIGDWATSAASNEFNNAYGKFQDNQNNRQGDYRDVRNFNSDELNRMAGRSLGDRGLMQSSFEGDRSAGMQNNQFGNNFGMQQANFQQGAFEGDRSAGMNQNQFGNNWNMTNSQNMYGQNFDMADMGFNAADRSAGYATQGAMAQAGLMGDMATARANGTLGRYQANRGLVGDLFNGGMQVYGASQRRG